MAEESQLPGLPPATVPGPEPRPTHPAPAAQPEKQAPAPATKSAKGTAPPHHHDSFREFLETIVFVVVLVLILKTFLAEAFVIPTGSMATTLLGYQSEVKCEMCGHRFLVNKSKEADPTEARPEWIMGATCENCRFFNRFREVPPPPAPPNR